MATSSLTHLNDVVQSILDVGYECLTDTPNGLPKDHYISHGQPPDDCCFAAETRVVTSSGVLPIADLAGSEVELMTTDGEWVKAPIRSFGVQALREVTLSRQGEKKTIYATGSHRWLLDGRPSTRGVERSLVEKSTDGLTKGDILALETGVAYDGEMDPDGVRAGIVFGDGTATPYGSKVILYGPKASLGYLFDSVGRAISGDARHPGSIGFAGMPNEWKALPDVESPISYLYGWLAGYIATDGSVDGKRRQIRLASSRVEDMEMVRDVCYRLGIATSKVRVQMGKGFGAHDTPLFAVSLAPSTIPDGLLVRMDQRAEFHNAKSRPKAVGRWKVVGVRETGRVEEVFCASVEGTRAFVLEDNILTGNCDFLSAWVEYIRPIQGFENAQSVSGVSFSGRCCDVGAVADIAIRLVRPCYPTLVDNAHNPFPSAEDQQAAAEGLLIDGYKLRCCVMEAHCSGLLLPDDTNCLEVAWGDMLPYGPKGGCAGWTWKLTVELEQCCNG